MCQVFTLVCPAGSPSRLCRVRVCVSVVGLAGRLFFASLTARVCALRLPVCSLEDTDAMLAPSTRPVLVPMQTTI